MSKQTVTSIDDKGVNVEVNGVAAMIKKADLSKDKAAQNPENYKEGDVLEAKVTSVDKKNNKIGLSVKALEIEEEKKLWKSTLQPVLPILLWAMLWAKL